ncbi:HAT transposon superfamily [Actinidia rufa]|uniref:HAT transposon superfamily n=1 Tax=Actinidia rufa TaxID=165716 RepID=A0A7J0GWN1_9ERIC|nr:HAT transposon superfamily [Actinidia rufa]
MASGFEPVPLTSQKHDPAWKHCQMFKNGDRVQLKCLYCGKIFKGGGIHRIKEHLAGQKDELSNFNPTTSEIDPFTNQCGLNTEVTLIAVPETIEPNATFLVSREEETSNKGGGRKKKGRVRKASRSAMSHALAVNNSIVVGSKRVNNQVSVAIGRFFYDVGIPLDAVKSEFFQPMVDAIASQGAGVVAPSYHDLRSSILKNSLQEVRSDIDQCVGTWGKTGCSVLVDEWISEKGFYLNPKFFYSIEGDVHHQIRSSVYDCIEKLVPDLKIQDKIVKETTSYHNAVGDFGRKMAIRSRDTLLPDEWWSTYGGGCPNLARLAIRILSQTCSLIACKPNWVTIQQMHETKNCLEHQRLSDLVFVHYNLQLRQMARKDKEQDAADPISFENVGIVGDWVIEKEGCLEDFGSSDWMSVDPPLGNTTLLGPTTDDVEDLGAGFGDYEIFEGVRDSEEENVEDNIVSQ